MMSEIFLVRHAKSYANLRDFTAFGDEDSPLEPKKGIPQALQLKDAFLHEHGIDSALYDKSVLCSTYRRPKQTAELAGFKSIQTHSILNEAAFHVGELSPAETVAKHAKERWIPDEVRRRTSRFIQMIRKGELEHQIFFSHGIFIAGVKLILLEEAGAAGQTLPYEFDEKRGLIPDLATITRAMIKDL